MIHKIISLFKKKEDKDDDFTITLHFEFEEGLKTSRLNKRKIQKQIADAVYPILVKEEKLRGKNIK